MCTFLLKSYSPKQEILKPHFFILNKGNNSGKPLLSPCPNCFVIQFENQEDKECVYWLLWCMWQSKAFYRLLRGSVIPFINIKDFHKVLLQALNQLPYPDMVFKVVEALNNIETLENEYLQKINLLKDAKRLVMRKIQPKYEI
jgi:hypothetical protein